MADTDKLNIDSIIARLLEGTVDSNFLIVFVGFSRRIMTEHLYILQKTHHKW